MNVYESDSSEPDEDFMPVSKTRRRRTATASNNSAKAAQGAANDVVKYKCFKCPATFASKKELRHHKAAKEDHDYCKKCDRDFETYQDLEYHLIKSPMHIVCSLCMKEFQSEGGLAGHTKQMHRDSEAVNCPGCMKQFKSASGLTQHVENDLCTGGLRNQHLADRLLGKDPSVDPNLTTTSTHVWRDGVMKPLINAFDDLDVTETEGSLLDGPVDERGESLRVTVLDYTDTLKNNGAPKVTNDDIRKCWNPTENAYICYHKGCKKRYPLGAGLNPVYSMKQHLGSAIHAPKRFRCPTCLDRFRQSSALLQHVESGSCKLYNTSHFKLVQESLTGGMMDKEATLVPASTASTSGWDIDE